MLTTKFNFPATIIGKKIANYYVFNQSVVKSMKDVLEVESKKNKHILQVPIHMLPKLIL